MTKFCKDCKWAKPHWFWGLSMAQCTKSVDKPYSSEYYVTGKGKPTYFYCSTMRILLDQCGPEGKLFETKE